MLAVYSDGGGFFPCSFWQGPRLPAEHAGLRSRSRRGSPPSFVRTIHRNDNGASVAGCRTHHLALTIPSQTCHMIEIELKFLLDETSSKALLARLKALKMVAARRVTLRSVYMDTSEDVLKKAGIAPRIRRDGRRATVDTDRRDQRKNPWRPVAGRRDREPRARRTGASGHDPGSLDPRGDPSPHRPCTRTRRQDAPKGQEAAANDLPFAIARAENPYISTENRSNQTVSGGVPDGKSPQG